MSSQVYYKVVNLQLKSALSIQLQEFAIQYKVGEWVKPHPNTYCMVFDMLYAAKEFSEIMPEEPSEVYECEIVRENVIELPFCVGVFTKYKVVDFLRSFFSNVNNQYLPKYTYFKTVFELPDRCVLASSVKLIRKVL